MVWAFESAGQTRKVHFEKLGLSDGLPQTHIFTMMQDRDGYMWFCTMGGLSKFDGERFINYRHNRNDSTSISGNWIYKIVEAEGDICYVATTSGFNVFDKRKETFVRYTADPGREDALVNHRIHDIALTGGRHLWLAHAKGISRFDIKTEKFKNFTHPEFSFSRHAPSVSITHDGHVFAGSNFGLFTISADSSGLDHIPVILEDKYCRVRQITQRHGRLWLATNHGVITYDRHTRQYEKVPIPLDDSTPSVNSFVWDTDSTAYIGGSIGLHRIHMASGRLLASYNYAANNPEGISGDVVYSLLIDNAKNIWLGLFDGINIINPNAESFRVYYNEPGISNLKNATLIIHTTREGEIWTSTMKGVWYKSALDAVPRIVDFEGYLKYEHFPAMGFAQDASGVLWLSKKDHGLMNNAGGKFSFRMVKPRSMLNDAAPKQMLSQRHDANKLWVATNKGLLRLDAVSGDTLWIRPRTYDKALGSNNIGAITEDEQGIIWFVSNGRLCSYLPSLDQLLTYPSDSDDSTAWFGNSAYRIDASNDRIYLSGPSFSFYDKRENRFYNYTTETEVKIGLLPSVTVDREGDAWFPSGSGIWHFDAQTSDLKKYDIQYLGGGYITSSANTTPDGRVLFGSYNGITEIKPWQVLADTLSTQVVLSNVLVDNSPVELDKAIQFTDTLHLSYKNTLLVIQYAALKFMKKGGLQYRYKLDGLSNKWVEMGSRTEITFNDLSPGKYDLTVEATNDFGAKCRKPLNLLIIIAPPFWQTSWFYTFVVGILLLIIFLVYRNLVRIQSLQQAKAVAEQNDQYKSRFLAHMSHEFRTPMNAIMGLNHLLMHSGLDDQQLKYTESIKSSCDNLLWMVDNILDQAKIESGTIKLQHTAFYPREVFKQVHNLLSLKAAEKGLAFSLDIDPEFPNEVMGDPVRLFQILVNLSANAIKFTKHGSVTISGTIEQTDELPRMILKVSDTGIGIEPEALEKIFDRFEQVNPENNLSEGVGLGLAIVKQLVDTMKGSITVNSRLNEGSVFTIGIPYEPLSIPNGDIDVSPGQKVLPDGMEILIVEDIATNRFVATQLLKLYNENINITEAEDGKQAVEVVQLKRFDVILMDVRMPVMDGLTATRKIRQLAGCDDRQLPIIGLTANATPEQLEACIAAGMNAYVTKPIDVNELISKLQA